MIPYQGLLSLRQDERINMKIILASASPRRRELLAQIGLEFEVRVSNVEEHITSRIPGKIVQQLAQQKAHAVFDEMLAEEIRGNLQCGKRMPREACLIIGADTVVSFEDEILGKPTSKDEAEAMLNMLSGKTHQVYTGVAMIYYPGYQEDGESGNVECKSFFEQTDVTFYSMRQEEIEEYISTGDCMDKAGAYGIQGFCARYIQGIKGDYNNVVGLPVGRLYQEIKEWL